jgi:hypothetical protein
VSFETPFPFLKGVNGCSGSLPARAAPSALQVGNEFWQSLERELDRRPIGKSIINLVKTLFLLSSLDLVQMHNIEETKYLQLPKIIDFTKERTSPVIYPNLVKNKKGDIYMN